MEIRALLTTAFFERPAVLVAQELLGKCLVRRFEDREESFFIRETEAYGGPEDLASHARFGKTKRNEVMFGPPGHFYLYFIYGMHWMLNVVVEKDGIPSAVLIRGTREVTGPGRLTKYLQLDGSFNGLMANADAGMWFEDRGFHLEPVQIERTPRIGIDSAEEWKMKPYRFVYTT